MAFAKKQFSSHFGESVSLDVSGPLDQIPPETLAGYAKDAGVALAVVDVRQPDEFAKGHIAGSRNVPYGEALDAATKQLCADAAAAIKDGKKPAVVFVSFQSPDLDVNAALQFASEWDDGGHAAASAVAADRVAQTLLGGVCVWLQKHKDDPALTAAYDAAHWDDALAKLTIADAAPVKEAVAVA